MSADAQYINTRQMAAELGLERKYVTNKITKRDDFPAPALRMTRKTVLWLRSEWEAWKSNFAATK